MCLPACTVNTEEPTVDNSGTTNFDINEYNKRETDISAPIRGAHAYDQWFSIANEPGELHPLIEFENPLLYSKSDTWRCSLCHGWDYNGEFIFNFPGLIDVRLQTANELFNAIKYGWIISTRSINSRHVFSNLLSDGQIYDLCYFIKTRIKNFDIASGNPIIGKDRYTGACLQCHANQTDGTPNLMLLSLASDNPGKFIHISRFGTVADLQMPNIAILFPGATDSEQVVIDILVFLQQFNPVL